MAGWKIRVTNRSGSKINVMIFQTVPDDLLANSYCTAWRLIETPHSGDFNVELPETFNFYVIEQQNERKSGPYSVSYGYEVEVLQKNAAEPPAVTIKSNEYVPKDQIKVTNLTDNAQPLEMALFKKESKMVFYKDIVPNAFLFMAIKSTVYMTVVSGVEVGQEFPTNLIVNSDGQIKSMLSVPTEFELLKSKLALNIEITKKSSGEYVFTNKEK